MKIISSLASFVRWLRLMALWLIRPTLLDRSGVPGSRAIQRSDVSGLLPVMFIVPGRDVRYSGRRNCPAGEQLQARFVGY